MTRTPLLVSFM